MGEGIKEAVIGVIGIDEFSKNHGVFVGLLGSCGACNAFQ